ncbi:unnamed protein product [Arabis nemorensis]|uniref:Uncharacterized protein n=1 Tax=Arabis nemorensis TaxID=586526 RepID=A0A565B6I2_9BRAS|nr:unnamed protein product [Arabis nemorensis]
MVTYSFLRRSPWLPARAVYALHSLSEALRHSIRSLSVTDGALLRSFIRSAEMLPSSAGHSCRWRDLPNILCLDPDLQQLGLRQAINSQLEQPGTPKPPEPPDPPDPPDSPSRHELISGLYPQFLPSQLSRSFSPSWATLTLPRWFWSSALMSPASLRMILSCGDGLLGDLSWVSIGIANRRRRCRI